MEDGLDLALPKSDAQRVVLVERKGNGESNLSQSDVTVTSELEKTGPGRRILEAIDTPDKIRNVVLVGRTGNGKSATGNTMLREKVFKSKLSAVGVTTTCELQTTVLDDARIINVIDTPGLFDFSGDPDFIQREIINCIGLAKDGIHAVLVVLSLTNRFSREEKEAVTYLLNFFGERIQDYMIVVITGGDELEANEETMEDVMGPDCPEPLTDILEICGNRYVVIDNRTRDELKMDEQLNQLYGLVEEVFENNDRKPYIDDMFLQLSEELHMFSNDAESSHEVCGLDVEIWHDVSESDSKSSHDAKVCGMDAESSHDAKISGLDDIIKVAGLDAETDTVSGLDAMIQVAGLKAKTNRVSVVDAKISRVPRRDAKTSTVSRLDSKTKRVSGLDAKINAHALDSNIKRVPRYDAKINKVSRLDSQPARSYQPPKDHIANMVKSKLEVTAHVLKQQLDEERQARYNAEEKAQADRSRSDEEIQRMRKKLQLTRREAEDPLAFLNTCPFL